MFFSNALWLNRLVCQRQMLIVRFGVRILLETRKVFQLDNSILTKIEIYLKEGLFVNSFFLLNWFLNKFNTNFIFYKVYDVIIGHLDKLAWFFWLFCCLPQLTAPSRSRQKLQSMKTQQRNSSENCRKKTRNSRPWCRGVSRWRSWKTTTRICQTKVGNLIQGCQIFEV